MSDDPNSTETRPAASGSGSKKLLILLVIAALTVAAVLAVKTMQRRQTMDEVAVGSGETRKDSGALDLPLFAPKPDPAAESAEPEAPAGEQPAANGGSASVTMSASPAEPHSDRVLTPDFVRDLARLLAANYHPAHTLDNPSNRGITRLTFKKLNMRYGTELTGMKVDSQDAPAGRNQALSHLFSPIVLRLAFDIFSQPLVDELLVQAAQQKRSFKDGSSYVQRPLTDGQIREMLSIYAALVADAGRAFQAFASRPDLTTALNRYSDASSRVNAAYARYADREAVGAPQEELDAISLEIKNAIQAREKMRAGLLTGIRTGTGSMLAESDVMDIASWIHRRLAADPDAMNAVGAIASLSTELSQRLTETRYPPKG